MRTVLDSHGVIADFKRVVYNVYINIIELSLSSSIFLDSL